MRKSQNLELFTGTHWSSVPVNKMEKTLVMGRELHQALGKLR